jgi:hypothetical protein
MTKLGALFDAHPRRGREILSKFVTPIGASETRDFDS